MDSFWSDSSDLWDQPALPSTIACSSIDDSEAVLQALFQCLVQLYIVVFFRLVTREGQKSKKTKKTKMFTTELECTAVQIRIQENSNQRSEMLVVQKGQQHVKQM